uniref:Uncharacterized protein n=1 Tax=Romanomermis culicivorax TaxID=13658 RepID=A0A915IF81_ROMCU
MTWKAMAIGVGVPIIGLVLDVWDFKNSWENYQNGAQSALAVYELVTAGVFIATSFASLAIGILILAGFTVVPVIGWIIYAVATVPYIAGHIWKIIDDPEAFKKFFSTLWDSFLSIPEFLSHPIKFLESQQAEDAKHVVNVALQIMEDNTMIQNVFSTPTCRENM